MCTVCVRCVKCGQCVCSVQFVCAVCALCMNNEPVMCRVRTGGRCNVAAASIIFTARCRALKFNLVQCNSVFSIACMHCSLVQLLQLQHNAMQCSELECCGVWQFVMLKQCNMQVL